MKLGCIALCLALASCATQQQRANLDLKLGQPPSDAAAAQAINDTLARALKDPDSLKQFRIRSGPTRISWYQGLLAGGDFDVGWLYCFEYNAKNSYGGYVGLKVDGLALRTATNGDAYVVPVNWGTADTHC
jgi:hypothetical protein